MTKASTICWNCKNAVPSEDGLVGCNWSRNLQPVDGWTAEETVMNLDYGDAKNRVVRREVGYVVLDCPGFEVG